MLRVKFLKNHKRYITGQSLVMDNTEAFALIDRGIAILTKDMTEQDYKTLDEEQANGINPKLRTNVSK